MSVRGWVYVLSNSAMPGLVKVGFSTKDPVFRIDDLSGTGHPYAFTLEYDALVVEPRDVEMKVHKRLAAKREAKEFFRTDVQTVVAAIRDVLRSDGKTIISEQTNYLPSPDELPTRQLETERRDCENCGEPAMRPTQRRCSKCFSLLLRKCRACEMPVMSSTQRRCLKCFALLE